jgi:hypothetical protein
MNGNCFLKVVNFHKHLKVSSFMKFDLLVEKILKTFSHTKVHTLLEKRFQKTTLMYHGTSSAFLRSILKNGLDPNPKQKSWDLGGTMPSLGGVYLAPTAGRSTRRAADEAVKKYGGEPILITVQTVTASGTPDEDNIFNTVASSAYEMYRSPNSPYENLTNILQLLKSKAKLNQQSESVLKQFVDTAISILKRENFPTNKGSMYAENWLLQQPELKQLMTSVLNTMKPSMSEHPSNSPNIRITRPIGFSGKTRIVSIINMQTNQVLYGK